MFFGSWGIDCVREVCIRSIRHMAEILFAVLSPGLFAYRKCNPVFFFHARSQYVNEVSSVQHWVVGMQVIDMPARAHSSDIARCWTIHFWTWMANCWWVFHLLQNLQSANVYLKGGGFTINERDWLLMFIFCGRVQRHFLFSLCQFPCKCTTI